jgi:hypothetical protein
MKIQRSRVLSVFIEAKDQGLVEFVAAEVDVEAVANLRTLAGFTSMPSLELKEHGA